MTEVKEEVISDEEASGGQSAKSEEYFEEADEDKMIKLEPKVEPKDEPTDEPYAAPLTKIKNINDEEIEKKNQRYEKIHSECKKIKIEPPASIAPQERKYKVDR